MFLASTTSRDNPVTGGKVILMIPTPNMDSKGKRRYLLSASSTIQQIFFQIFSKKLSAANFIASPKKYTPGWISADIGLGCPPKQSAKVRSYYGKK